MRDELIRLLQPTVEALGYELVEIECSHSGEGAMVRVYIDAPAGIGLEDCEHVSHAVSAALDAADPIPGRYRLEVSSPGLDRVLRTPEHFARFVASRIKVQLALPIEGRRRFTGVLLEAGAAGVTLQVDGSRVQLAYEQIQKARLVPVL
ncbi:MAG TPA: ribosome maturation factor RimP [Steroidobacteraceae bacterium]|nr:ribosome maturation factor RimP [Steroidobacteraceae bacterium]